MGHESLAVSLSSNPALGFSAHLAGAQAAFSLLQFFNSVRLWDFIEDRESRSAPGADSEVTELGELFMHLSGAEEEPAAAP